MLDAIARDTMGGTEHVVALMAANPHVSGLPAVLPAGLELMVPEPAADAATPERPIRLWGRG